MDTFEVDENEPSVYLVAFYAVLSFVCAMLMVLLLYVACARKYRLNWFEKNLLEVADTKSISHSREALVGGLQECKIGSSKSLCTTTATTSPMEHGKFWVPHNQQKQNSFVQKEIQEERPSDCTPPASPTSITSANLHTNTAPIAGNDKVVISATSPIKPRIATMQSKLDHTKIDTSLYQKESPVEAEDIRGSVHVTLIYDPIAGILTIRLIEAQDLQAKDFSGTADPYAKIRLLPDKTNVWQTRIHKKTLNPVFDEDFVFEVTTATLGRHILEVLLYDFDAYSRHHSIGGVQFPLCNIDLSEKIDLWKQLAPLAERDARVDLGELMISLAYLSSAERLTVVIIKARNLRLVDDTRNSSDPYVKVSLLQGTKRIKKRKTGVHRNTICPVFNEAFTFDIDKDTLKKSCIEFHVMHDSLLGASEFLGHCRVGRTKECKNDEKDFFIEMLQSKTATAKWLALSDPRTPP